MVFAQDYHTLVSEGKQWKEYQETIGRTRYEFTYTISSDTVIAGEEYHKLFIEYIIYDLSKETGNPEVFFTQPRTFFAGLQQRDGRVYIHQYDKKRLLYDFTLKEGDIAFEDATHVQRVTKVDTILVNGSLRRRLFLSETWKGVEQVVEETGCWVEGIGGSRGLERPHDWFAIGGEHRLTECIEDGTCIFTAADFSAPAYRQGSIDAIKKGIKPDSENTPITYDLQGRRVTGSPRPGVYIENGRKRVVSR